MYIYFATSSTVCTVYTVQCCKVYMYIHISTFCLSESTVVQRIYYISVGIAKNGRPIELNFIMLF